ncbi:hypothetical protein GJ496_001634 [Pomphorhynchus laevis]|nr:hypothetical protein GJ496_001634 [Pomphorhynchus laevis]
MLELSDEQKSTIRYIREKGASQWLQAYPSSSLNRRLSAILRHDHIRNVLAKELERSCREVTLEPVLQEVREAHRFEISTTSRDVNARSDISCRGRHSIVFSDGGWSLFAVRLHELLPIDCAAAPATN